MSVLRTCAQQQRDSLTFLDFYTVAFARQFRYDQARARYLVID